MSSSEGRNGVEVGSWVRFVGGGRYVGRQEWDDGDRLEVGDVGRVSGVSAGLYVVHFPMVKCRLQMEDIEYESGPVRYSVGDAIEAYWRQPANRWFPGTVIGVPTDEDVPVGCACDIRWRDGTLTHFYTGLFRKVSGGSEGDASGVSADASVILRQELSKYLASMQGEADGWRQLSEEDSSSLGEMVQRRISGMERAAALTERFVDRCASSASDGAGRAVVRVQAAAAPHVYDTATGTTEDYCTLDDVLTQLHRDWCVGHESAVWTKHHKVILDALRDRKELGACLVPGDGLCRLSYELAHLGAFSEVVAVEASPVFTAAAEYVMNRAEQFEIAPLAHQLADQDCIEPQLAPVVAPCDDAWPIRTPPCPYQILTGSFEQIYSRGDAACKGSFGCIVTAYFIDALPCVVDVVESVMHLLADGGLWVNLGPLHYHSGNARPKLSYEELRALIAGKGFRFEEESRVEGAVYCDNAGTHHRPQVFNPRFFVARKQSCCASGGCGRRRDVCGAGAPALSDGIWSSIRGGFHRVVGEVVEWSGGGVDTLSVCESTGRTGVGSCYIVEANAEWVKWTDGDEWSKIPGCAVADAPGGYTLDELAEELQRQTQGCATVDWSVRKGRHAVAARDLPEGELVLESVPLVTTLASVCRRDFCVDTCEALAGRDVSFWNQACAVFQHWDSDKDGFLRADDLSKLCGEEMDEEQYQMLCESLEAPAGMDVWAFAKLCELGSVDVSKEHERVSGRAVDLDEESARVEELLSDTATRTRTLHALDLQKGLSQKWAATLSDNCGKGPPGATELIKQAAGVAAELIHGESEGSTHKVEMLLWKSHFNSFPVCGPLPMSTVLLPPCRTPAEVRWMDVERGVEVVLALGTQERAQVAAVNGVEIQRMTFVGAARLMEFDTADGQADMAAEVPAENLPEMLSAVRSICAALAVPHNIGDAVAVRWDIDLFKQTGGGAGTADVRQIGIGVHGATSMLNHSQQPSLRTEFGDAGKVLFYTRRDVAAGEELSFAYGGDECAVRQQYMF